MKTLDMITTYDNVFWLYMSRICDLSRHHLNNEVDFVDDYESDYNHNSLVQEPSNNYESDYDCINLFNDQEPCNNSDIHDNPKVKKIRRGGKKQINKEKKLQNKLALNEIDTDESNKS